MRAARDVNSQDPQGANGEDESDVRDPAHMYGVLVSLRSLLKFLSSHVVSTTTIACELVSAPHFPLNQLHLFHRYLPKPLHDPLRLHRRGG